MTIYVVETIYDYLVQVGFSLSKETAQKMADRYTKKSRNGHKFFVTAYTINNEKSYKEFDNG